jgi:hypothetical protein
MRITIYLTYLNLHISYVLFLRVFYIMGYKIFKPYFFPISLWNFPDSVVWNLKFGTLDFIVRIICILFFHKHFSKFLKHVTYITPSNCHTVLIRVVRYIGIGIVLLGKFGKTIPIPILFAQ